MKLIVYSIPIFIVLITLEIIYAYVRKSSLYRFNDAVSNINCGVLQQVIGAISKTLLIVGYIFIYNNWRIFSLSDHLWTWLLLFIGVDFFYYWFHRYAHEINLFWGTHVVHHQSEEYNLSVALRQSSLQAFVSTWFYLPLAFIGFNPVSFITVSALQTLYQFWIHTRVINKMPTWFEYIMNTPSHHRVHHGRNPKYIDKNHGGTFIIWDRLFGTFQQEEETVVYGVTKALNTWNPLYANIDYYKNLWNECKAMPTALDRLRLLVNRPGWRPTSLGGPQVIPSITPDDRIRYDTDITMAMNYYIGAQFILLLGMVSYYLNSFDTMAVQPRVLFTLYIILSTVNIAMLFESRRLAHWVNAVVLFILVAGWYVQLF